MYQMSGRLNKFLSRNLTLSLLSAFVLLFSAGQKHCVGDEAVIKTLIEGVDYAISQIKSGEGLVVEKAKTVLDENRKTLFEGKYEIKFSDDEYIWRLITLGNIVDKKTETLLKKQEVNYLVYINNEKSIIDNGKTINIRKSRARRGGFQDPTRALAQTYGRFSLKEIEEELDLLGKEVIDGSECYILECTSQDGGSTTRQRLWIDPQRGFMFPKIRVWNRFEGMEQEVLTEEISCKAKKYSGDLWGPEQYNQLSYRLKGKERYLWSEKVLTFPNYVYNISIPREEFKIEFSVGRRVNDWIIGTSYVVGKEDEVRLLR